MENMRMPQLHDPYRIAPDTWVIPEIVPAGPGTVDHVGNLLPVLEACPNPTETDDAPEDLWRESLLFSAGATAPWHTMLDPAKFERHVDAVAGLAMTVVASAHAATLRGQRLNEAFGLIRQIHSMDNVTLPGQADLDALLAVERLAVA